MNNAPKTCLDYALGYARHELPVFPLQSVHSGDCSCGRDNCSSTGKHPRTQNGVKDATTDVEQITRWWTQWPEANIGLATGNGLYVIDIDCAKGGSVESLQDLGIDNYMWTRTARTGSGGYHLYLRCEQPLGNTAGKLAPFVDTRGEGGYVVAPPSRNKHGRYSWYNGSPMQSVPEKLLSRLGVPTRTFFTLAHNPSVAEQSLATSQEQEKKHAQAHITSENAASTGTPGCATPADAQPEEDAPVSPASVAQEARNSFLVRQAGYLRGQGLPAREICALLLALNEARYGEGRHPQGALESEELERTVFKSVKRWEAEGGVRPVQESVVDELTSLMGRVIPAPIWLVPDLLCEGLVLFAGKPKLGKSWLALSLALTCALGTANQGGLAFGRYPVERSTVFYLSLEDSASRLQGRARKLLNGRAAPDNFHYVLSWRPLLMGGISDLEAFLQKVPDTRLVIIDTLARVRMASASGNVYQEDYMLMSALHELAVRHHITLILVHHTRKMSSSDAFDEVSGSTGLTGAADTSIVLKRERNQNDAILHLTGRDIEEQELALTFNNSDCTWTVTGSAAEHQVSQSRQAVLDLLAQNEAMTPAEIAKELEKPRENVKSLLRRLKKEELVESDRDGCYRLRNQEDIA